MFHIPGDDAFASSMRRCGTAGAAAAAIGISVKGMYENVKGVRKVSWFGSLVLDCLSKLRWLHLPSFLFCEGSPIRGNGGGRGRGCLSDLRRICLFTYAIAASFAIISAVQLGRSHFGMFKCDCWRLPNLIDFALFDCQAAVFPSFPAIREYIDGHCFMLPMTP